MCNLLRRGNYFTKIDLKDAYLAIPLSQLTSQYFCFSFQGKIFSYEALPFGFSLSPLIFTKVMKVVVRYLRQKGIKLIIYLDDILLIHETLEQARSHTQITVDTLQRLGFTINFDKSVLSPGQLVEYLGLLFDSRNMTIALPERKKTKIKKLLAKTLKHTHISIQEASELQGNLIAACPATQYGLLFTRELARLIALNLAKHNKDYSKIMTLSQLVKEDLLWWQNSLDCSVQFIRPDIYDKTIYTDACPTGYGGHYNNETVNGHWTVNELQHINALELIAVERVLHHFCDNDNNIKIHLRVDNKSAVAYINRLGGTHSLALLTVAKRIWTWAMDRNIWLTATYIKSKDNALADEQSRITISDLHWQLNTSFFESVTNHFGQPSIDLFASRSNAQLGRYISYLLKEKLNIQTHLPLAGIQNSHTCSHLSH